MKLVIDKTFLLMCCLLLPVSMAAATKIPLFSQQEFQPKLSHSQKPKSDLAIAQEDMDHAQQDVNQVLNDIAPDKNSALSQRIKQEDKVSDSLFGITFDQPTYVLPLYYSSNPNKNIGQTPDDQQVKNISLKAQLSLKFPLWKHILGSRKWSLNVSYTQLSYWQVYAKSQYFSETNYEPALYVSDHYLPNWLASIGVVHQSNGRGGEYERSWNRAFADVTFSGPHWLVSFKPWILIFKADSSDLHNPHIAKYLGYARTVVAYKFYHQEVSLMFRNLVTSGFSRGAEELDYSFPLHGHLLGYLQYFHGYGQSLIEYKTKTNSLGIGIALSNWI